MTKNRHLVDAHVGTRLRLRRGLMGWSQERLGLAIGLTFQQIQKYEKGTNRISCSRLYEFARLFDVPPSYFFEDLPTGDLPLPGGDTARAPVPDRAHRDTLELVRAFEQLADADLRLAVVRFVEALAEGMTRQADEAPAAKTAGAG